MTWLSGALLEAALPASPLYVATTLWLPTARALVLQLAVRVLPVPVRATVLQPLRALPSATKLTLPLGLVPLTLAVKVTLTPTVAGLSELVRVVVVGAGAA